MTADDTTSEIDSPLARKQLRLTLLPNHVELMSGKPKTMPAVQLVEPDETDSGLSSEDDSNAAVAKTTATTKKNAKKTTTTTTTKKLV